MKKYTNIYYFNTICKIGGIETFFYQLAKKYKDIDLTIVYKYADPKQLERLRKFVRCERFNGEKIICEKAFFNFNTDIIDDVDAKEYCLVVHGDYRMLDGPPPKHPKITKYYGVSQVACDSYTELTGIPCELTYNPIDKEPYKPLIKLCSACRLDDPVKGGKRTLQLIDSLDKYSREHNVNYMWTIFTNSITDIVSSPNVAFMQPRLDIMPYMLDADYVVQLSDDFEGYNYTINEALLNGTPIVITPCKVYKELGIDDSMAIRLDFDMSNIDDVVEKIFNSKLKPKYTPPKDNWENIFIKKKSNYDPKELEVPTKIKILYNYEDLELGRYVDRGEIIEVPLHRAELLMSKNLAIPYKGEAKVPNK